MKKKKPNPIALLPIVVFLVLYLRKESAMRISRS